MNMMNGLYLRHIRLGAYVRNFFLKTYFLQHSQTLYSCVADV